MFDVLRSLALAAALVVVPGAVLAETLTLDWPDLRPAEGEGTPIPTGIVQHGTLTPSDLAARSPFGDAFRDALTDPKSLQPQSSAIRSDLDGKRVRIAGFVTPLGFDGTKVSEFFLVPYVGACIHVPPPPANQIVMVTKAEGFDLGSLFDPVWVEGELRAIPISTDIADVGYQMVAPRVSAYK